MNKLFITLFIVFMLVSFLYFRSMNHNKKIIAEYGDLGKDCLKKAQRYNDAIWLLMTEIERLTGEDMMVFEDKAGQLKLVKARDIGVTKFGFKASYFISEKDIEFSHITSGTATIAGTKEFIEKEEKRIKSQDQKKKDK